MLLRSTAWSGGGQRWHVGLECGAARREAVARSTRWLGGLRAFSSCRRRVRARACRSGRSGEGGVCKRWRLQRPERCKLAARCARCFVCEKPCEHRALALRTVSEDALSCFSTAARRWRLRFRRHKHCSEAISRKARRPHEARLGARRLGAAICHQRGCSYGCRRSSQARSHAAAKGAAWNLAAAHRGGGRRWRTLREPCLLARPTALAALADCADAAPGFLSRAATSSVSRATASVVSRAAASFVSWAAASDVGRSFAARRRRTSAARWGPCS